MLIDRSVLEFAAKTASKDPTPGGGSVAALAGLLGSALSQMVFGLSEGKKMYEALSDEDKESMKSSFESLKKTYSRLAELVDEDGKAFDQVMEAFGMPKETEEEKKLRSEKIQEGYRIALEVPLETASLCLKVLEDQQIFAFKGNANAITDAGVACMMAHTGCEGALFNVEINLSSIKDEVYAEGKRKEIEAIREKAALLRKETLTIVNERMKG